MHRAEPVSTAGALQQDRGRWPHCRWRIGRRVQRSVDDCATLVAFGVWASRCSCGVSTWRGSAAAWAGGKPGNWTGVGSQPSRAVGERHSSVPRSGGQVGAPGLWACAAGKPAVTNRSLSMGKRSTVSRAFHPHRRLRPGKRHPPCPARSVRTWGGGEKLAAPWRGLGWCHPVGFVWYNDDDHKRSTEQAGSWSQG